MTVLARLDHVSRRFGDVLAVDDVTLDIHSGSILGLLGPNGAGKSTVLTMLQGLRKPTTGTVTLFGGSPGDYRMRQKLGGTPQETALPPTLRVGEVIDFVGRHFEEPLSTAAVAEEFGLGELLKRQTGALSGGQKRRLSVALAFVGQPRLVLLDEPTTGLDVDARRTLWDAVRRQHERGATVVVTSHYLEEIEALAERVVVMGHGRVIADDTVAAVINQVSLRQVRLVTDQPDRVSGLPGVVGRDLGENGSATFYATDSDRLIVDLVRSGIPFTDLTVRGATLEEAFLTLTGATDAATGQAARPASDAGELDGARTRADAAHPAHHDHAARSAQKEMNR
jgi:ABC-2 type transport system ATP-binding protein